MRPNNPAKGSALPQAKLTEEDIKHIFELVDYRNELREKANQLSNKGLAEKFGVHKSTIEKVLMGQIWRHV